MLYLQVNPCLCEKSKEGIYRLCRILHQCIKRDYLLIRHVHNRGKQLSLPHCETFKDKRRLLYNSRESTAINMEPGQRYEILKIWVPNHGEVNVYRSPGGGTETILEAHFITRKRIALKPFPCCCFFC